MLRERHATYGGTLRLFKRLVIAALVPVSALALSNCAGSGETADRGTNESPSEPTDGPENTFDVTGTVEVEAISNGRPGAPCRPDEETAQWPARPGSQRSGVQVGGDVTITDASGEVVGLGEVSLGEYMESGYDVSSYCLVPFKVHGVRDGDPFYGLEVAALPMERYTREELGQPIAIDVPDN